MSAAIIRPGVQMGSDCRVDEFCIIGEGRQALTRIGKNAIIRSHSIIYAGNTIGDGFQTGHGILVREDNVIGDNVSIGTHSVVEHHVKIGRGVRIHTSAFIPEFSVLEEGAWIGPNVVLTNARYPLSRNVKETLAGPHIGAGAKVGANATILPGVSIGAGALIGAGAVVTKDVPAGAIMIGNPARQVNTISSIEVY